jgi:hypothetical protein
MIVAPGHEADFLLPKALAMLIKIFEMAVLGNRFYIEKQNMLH